MHRLLPIEWIRWVSGALLLMSAPMLAYGTEGILAGLGLASLSLLLNHHFPSPLPKGDVETGEVHGTRVAWYRKNLEGRFEMQFDRCTVRKLEHRLMVTPRVGFSWPMLRWFGAQDAVEISLLDAVRAEVLENDSLCLRLVSPDGDIQTYLMLRLVDADSLAKSIGLQQFPMGSLGLDRS